MQVELAHYLPGRARLRLPGLRGRPRDLASIGQTLAAVPGAGRVQVSPGSASLVLTFDPHRTSLHALLSRVPGLTMPGMAGLPEREAAAARPVPARPDAVRSDAARTGLSTREAARRRQTFGPNLLPARPAPPFWRRFLGEFTDLSSVILLGGTGFSVLTGRVWEALAVGAAAGLNAVIGAWRSGQVDVAVAAMQSLTSPNATAVRDGRVTVIPAADLVPGDLILLQAGDHVPADVVVAEAMDLEADDRHLLGADAAGPKTYAANQFLPAGCEILRGHGEAVVLSTGADTTLGKIAQTLGRTERLPSHVQRRAAWLARDLLKIALLGLGIVTGVGLLWGLPPTELLQRGLSVATASVPEGLPTYITLALAAGSRRLARRNAFVRDLSTAAGVGTVDVICTDKTGTLTRGEMTVRTIFAGNHWWTVSGTGFDPTGQFLKVGEPADPLADPDLRAFLEAAVRCNNATLVDSPDGSLEVRGSQTEGALLILALKAGLPREIGREPRLGEEAFHPALRRMTLTLGVGGMPFTCSKGAPEAILPLCDRVLIKGGPESLGAPVRDAILDAQRTMTAGGQRVLALAYAHGPDRPNGMIFAGLVGIVDPPRLELRPVIQRLRKRSVQVIMLTGDHPDTAASVARDLRILHGNQEVVTGAQLAKLNDQDLARVVNRSPVFARVTPEQKAQVVRALQQHGLTVAYVGDGIDDAPAVRAADIGVVPRDRAADVTREAASIILTDDRLQTLETAIEQGRNTAANADEIARYLLIANMGEILLLAASAVFGMPLALLPLQLLWLNLIGDGPAALALGERHAPPGEEREPHRRPLVRSLEREILLHGLGVGAAAFGLYATALAGGYALPVARALAFSALSASQILYLFRCRTALGTPCGLRLPTEPSVTLAAVASGLLLLATMYFPPLARTLGTAPLSMGQWLAVLGTALAVNLSSVVRLSLRRRAAIPAPV
ncbi:MAG TPA: HAD-IC family P-type ATPase [Symbiobacteriaceae bacterium]